MSYLAWVTLFLEGLVAFGPAEAERLGGRATSTQSHKQEEDRREWGQNEVMANIIMQAEKIVNHTPTRHASWHVAQNKHMQRPSVYKAKC